MKNNQWDEEVNYLAKVNHKIEEQLTELRGLAADRRNDLIHYKEHLADDITLDLTNWFETAIELTQQFTEISRQSKSYDHSQKSIKKLEAIENHPYYGKLIFVEDERHEEEKIYIGITSVIDQDTHEILVYDWRAPISGMFYDVALGPASYEAPSGSVTGEILLKRQFIIEAKKLETFFDTELRIGDELLQQVLGKNTNKKMKNIVTTIQKEQNRIIRDNSTRFLIVQGVAGSGKTSIALQRIAYLLYKYRESWNEQNVLLFSPNPMFNDYISNVLPELGEKNMQQTTYQQYAEYSIGKEYKIENRYDQMEYLLSEYNDDNYFARSNRIRMKSSFRYAETLDSYIQSLAQEGMMFKAFTIRGKTVISAATLDDLFYHKYKKYPLHTRVQKMKDWLVDELRQIYKRKWKNYYLRLQKKPNYLGTEEELKKQSKKTVKTWFSPLFAQAKKMQFIDIISLYKQLLSAVELVNGAFEDETRKIPYEDVTPLLYLQSCIQGLQTMKDIKYVVIDEFQDYTPLEYRVIRKLFPKSRMMLLGDVNQSINGSRTNEELLGRFRSLFDVESTEIVTLNKSYRSTTEIVHFTSMLLRGEPLIIPFERSLELPIVKRVKDRLSDDQRKYAFIASEVQDLKAGGSRSIAIICKTAKESKKIYDALVGQIPAQLITQNVRTFVNEIVIIPSYLAKGLEFDSVIVWDAGKHEYSREEERKLFYTVCTRALHRLRILYSGELTPFITSIDNDLYDHMELQ